MRWTAAISLPVAALTTLAPIRCARDAASGPAVDERRTLVHDGIERSYLVHLPPTYEGTARLPLVLVFHGGGGGAAGTARMTRFSEKADDEGFIVVYPNGTGPLFEDRLLTWNAAPNCCGYALEHKSDDVGFIRDLVGVLRREYPVDEARIYATGLSNGAKMSFRLACELSDIFAAVAPVAGAMNCDCRPSRPVSVSIIHGTDDLHVLYYGGPPKKLVDVRHPREDKSVAYAVDFWVAHNGCSRTAETTEKGSIVTTRYGGGKDGTEVVLYMVRGGGHCWPGGEKWAFWADEPTRELDATDAIWDFFRRHPKGGPR